LQLVRQHLVDQVKGEIMIHQIKVNLIKVFLTAVGYLPACKKLIMFESFSGKQYSCNPKAIYEYMCQYHPEYHMYWSVDRKYVDYFDKEKLKIVERYSIKWLFLLGFSKFWVINSRMPVTLPKPKHTRYLQTWHGTPLKKLAFDMGDVHMPNTTTDQYKQKFYVESRNWDYLLSPNPYSSQIFRRAFRFEKELLETGYPRNDVFYQGDLQEKCTAIKKRLNIPDDKKVILYAPTWRDNQFYKVGHYKFDLPLDLKALQEQYGHRYIIILRMHYLVAENFDLTTYQGFAFDFSQGEDINDLYLISDLLITDYSSVFFDFAKLKRPIMFYTYDIEEYRDTLRGFYFNIEAEAPGPLVKDMAGVLQSLEHFDRYGMFLNYKDKYQRFYDKYCCLENGTSTKQVVEQILIND